MLNGEEVWSSKGWVLPQHYKIIKFLGKGSYGEVVQAQNLKSGQVVAIKRMKDLFQDPTDSKRVLRELHILKETKGTKGLV